MGLDELNEMRGCANDDVDNCAETKCCVSPGSTCYKKDDGWAACMASCVPGIDYSEPQQYQTPWSCEDLSEIQTCSADRVENCAETRCCISPGSTCYKKNDGWAACGSSCVPGIDFTEAPQYQSPWSCEVLSAPTVIPTLPPTTTPPIVCSEDRVENCAESKCCASSGSTCYKKDDVWATCRASCVPGIDYTDPPQYQTPWSCEVLSAPTSIPTLPPTLPPTTPPTSPRVVCSEDRVENCGETRCCTSPGSTCYKKDDGWATCMASCVPGIDYTDPPQYQTPWSCEVLSAPTSIPTLPPTLPPTTPPTSPPVVCSEDRVENCGETRCCTSPGSTCYKKDDGWATCMASCVPGIDYSEPPQYQTPWSCEVLSAPTSIPTLPPTLPPTTPPTSPPVVCSEDRVENCGETRCCTSPGSTCYKKDDGWATCMASCVPGIDYSEPPQYQTPWSCEVLSAPTSIPTLPPTQPPTTPPTSPPVVCSEDRVENCGETRCCTSPGSTCYKKDDGWATCMASCVPGIDYTDPPQYQTPWSCEVLSAPTSIPTLPPTLPPTTPPTSPPVVCSEDRVENCGETRCCTSPGSTCYKKDDGWATCMASCVPGIDYSEPPQYQTPWSCEVLSAPTSIPTLPPTQPPTTPPTFASRCMLRGQSGELWRDKVLHISRVYVLQEG